MIHFFHKTILLAGLLLGASASAVQAQKEKLQGVIDSALDIIYSEDSASLSFEEKQAKVRETLEAKYDLDVIIRRAIGRNWRVMSTDEQAEVLELVKQLVLKAYVKGLHGKERPKVTLGEVTNLSATRMEVDSTVVLDDTIYYVQYRLASLDSGWQIYDIVAENISVVSNYREQIDDHFRQGNGAELITKLEDLIAKNDLNEDTEI